MGLYTSNHSIPRSRDPYTPASSPSIGFTDLTSPKPSDQQRPQPTAYSDKEGLTNMRIVSPTPLPKHHTSQYRFLYPSHTEISQRRRAQNRASQRAFRERKEKRVQQLEQQLSELESKHRRLTQSYTDLGGAHQRLKREVGELRSELGCWRMRDGAAVELGTPEVFSSDLRLELSRT